MKQRKFNNAMNEIDDDMIAEAARPQVKRFSKIKIFALAAAAMLLLSSIFATVLVLNLANENTVVSFDVNPSVELKLGKHEKVVDIKAVNDDGAEILADLELKGTKLEEAVDKIVNAMVENGYLSAEQNSILVSVKSRNTKEAESLQQRIQDNIETNLTANSIDASIMVQVFDSKAENDEVKKHADKHNISIAKAILIDKIIEAGIVDSDGIAYDKDALAALKINELKLLIESKGLTIGQVVSSGNASASAYIGEQAAIDAALADASLSAEDVTDLEVEMDHHHGKMLYEVEFDFEEVEYEYEIDALTGEIVKIKHDADDHNGAHGYGNGGHGNGKPEGKPNDSECGEDRPECDEPNKGDMGDDRPHNGKPEDKPSNGEGNTDQVDIECPDKNIPETCDKLEKDHKNGREFHCMENK